MGSLLKKESIALYKVIAHIDSGQHFDMVYVTADRRRGTGGELESLKNWVKHNTFDSKKPTDREPKSRIATSLRDCNPQNFRHKTRNVINLKSRKIQKLHLKLIVEFNGKNVLL